MSNKNNLLNKAINAICLALIAFTPMIISSTTSVFFFGEPECPKHLKNRS